MMRTTATIGARYKRLPGDWDDKFPGRFPGEMPARPEIHAFSINNPSSQVVCAGSGLNLKNETDRENEEENEEDQLLR